MKPTAVQKLALGLVTVGLLGCNTPRYMTGYAHFWIYIPVPSLELPRGYPAEVSLPPFQYPTNRMQVRVAGEVHSPGFISVPVGCTVLQAIGYAGGFTDFGMTSRLRLTKADGKAFDLRLKSAFIDRSVCRRVYYQVEPLGMPKAQSAPYSRSKTDCVLEPGDAIAVRRVMF